MSPQVMANPPSPRPAQAVPRQALRYLVVGGLTYVVDLAVFLAVHAWREDAYLAANVAGRLAGALAGFVMHKLWTFEDRRAQGTGRQAVLYAAVLGGNIAASSALMFTAVDVLGADARLARVVVDVLIVGSTFWLSRRIFRAGPARA
jgi:putative flippase GtrA